jgi:hypothetical protein
MFRRAAGRPVVPHLGLAAQRRPTISRCQRTMVSSVTSSRSPWRRDFGITASKVASSARSAQSSWRRAATGIKSSILRSTKIRWIIKNRRIMDTRLPSPIDTFASTISAVIGLHFYRMA